MNTTLNEDGQHQLVEARQSYTGSRLTDSQFDEAWNVAGIIDREIHKSGSFVESLIDYAHAYARKEKFDAARGEMILRDTFTARYSQSMNQMRESLMEREANLPQTAKQDALDYARMIEFLIRDGATMPFWRALDHTGAALAEKLDITETGAKSLMRRVFQEVEDKDLYENGKAFEKQFHQPVREAEREARKAERAQLQRTGPSR